MVIGLAGESSGVKFMMMINLIAMTTHTEEHNTIYSCTVFMYHPMHYTLAITFTLHVTVLLFKS